MWQCIYIILPELVNFIFEIYVKAIKLCMLTEQNFPSETQSLSQYISWFVLTRKFIHIHTYCCLEIQFNIKFEFTPSSPVKTFHLSSYNSVYFSHISHT